MTKGNKRGHVSGSITSPSAKIDPKKPDNKITPVKFGSREIAKKSDKRGYFGTDEWCGSREKCKNKTKAATGKIKCEECKSNTHKECLTTDNFCLWCEELITLQKELADTSMIPWKEADEDSFESSDSINKPGGTNTNIIQDKIDTKETSNLETSKSYEEEIQELGGARHKTNVPISILNHQRKFGARNASTVHIGSAYT
jgi:late competence protein required for DNA uptake (superfamily II DNA/RNA helicase)